MYGHKVEKWIGISIMLMAQHPSHDRRQPQPEQDHSQPIPDLNQAIIVWL